MLDARSLARAHLAHRGIRFQLASLGCREQLTRLNGMLAMLYLQKHLHRRVDSDILEKIVSLIICARTVPPLSLVDPDWPSPILKISLNWRIEANADEPAGFEASCRLGRDALSLIMQLDAAVLADAEGLKQVADDWNFRALTFKDPQLNFN